MVSSENVQIAKRGRETGLYYSAWDRTGVIGKLGFILISKLSIGGNPNLKRSNISSAVRQYGPDNESYG